MARKEGTRGSLANSGCANLTHTYSSRLPGMSDIPGNPKVSRKLAKTFTLVRAMRVPGTRHLIARFRFNHVVQSIWYDALPKVLATCFPDVVCKQDRLRGFGNFQTARKSGSVASTIRNAPKKCSAMNTRPSS